MALLYDQEAEQVILGTLVNNPSLYNEVSEHIKADDLYFENHRIVFQAISDEIEQKNTLDLLLIISNLKEKELLDKIGNRSFLAKLADFNSPLSAIQYAVKIKDLSLRRQFHLQIKEIEKSTIDGATTLNEILYSTEKALQQASSRTTGDAIRHIKDSRDEFVEYIQQLQASKGGITGLATHFQKLDEITSGFKPGQLIILAARPGIGKTTLALNIAQNIALRNKVPIAFFTLEMSRIELIERMICSDAYVDARSFKRGFFNERQGQKIIRSLQKLTAADIYIDETPSLSAFDFKRKSRQLSNKLRRENKELKFIVVDYLQLMTDPISAKLGRQQEVQNISRDLKLIAKELGVPVFALSQMNRSIEQRGKDPEPQLSDLRESGSIEQDADIVMFIHRPDRFNKDIDPAKKNIAKIKIAKHRAGKIEDFDLFFKEEMNVFHDIVNQGMSEMAPPVIVEAEL